ncbi:unnamed protein product [Urochloa humidicola]
MGLPRSRRGGDGVVARPRIHARPRRPCPPAGPVDSGEPDLGSRGEDGGSGREDAAPVVEFSGREDVQRLLAEKMKGKSKNDYKGRIEQTSDYIKKLRACIRWYMELEDGYLVEQEKLRGAMDAENTRHTELERVNHDVKRFSEQLKMVQDTNKRLQEYNTSLQQYNSNLQADASKSGETISKLQKEKSAMMETMAALRECNNSVDSQLESSRQETIRVEEELRKEVECLRAELKQIRDDRDHSAAQLNNLNIVLANCMEQRGKSSKECESMSTKVSTLEHFVISAAAVENHSN